MVFRRLLTAGIMAASLTALAFVYKHFNPSEHVLFPKCPVKHVTGLDCPGCGSQRAIHYLLNGEFEKSFFQNPLLFVLLPYILVGFYLQLVPSPTSTELRLRKAMYGYRAIQVVFVVILLFTVTRNVI